jgi:hypothetical protein
MLGGILYIIYYILYYTLLLYIIYYTIIHIIFYYYILLLYIISYTILFFYSSLPLYTSDLSSIPSPHLILSHLPNLLFLSLPFPNPLLSSHSFYTCRYLHILIYIHLLSSPILFSSNPSQTRYPSLKGIHLSISRFKRNNTSIYLLVKRNTHLSISWLKGIYLSINSFYTCRYLHTVIYIIPILLPQQSDPARSIGVDG